MNKKYRIFSIAMGFGAILMGTLVLLGWYTKFIPFIQIHPSFVPMQFNTALGFVFSGISLHFLGFRKYFISGVAATVPLLLGVLTLIEYILGVNLGIDQLFMESYIVVKTSHPGRMAPNTALCFILIATPLSLRVLPPLKNRDIPYLNKVLGAMVLGLAFLCLCGYLLDLESAYGWGKLTRMAVHTSIGFLFLSLGLLSRFLYIDEKNQEPRFPIFLFTFILVVSLLFWRALSVESERVFQKMVQQEATKLDLIVQNRFNQSMLKLDKLKHLWESDYFKTRKRWLDKVEDITSPMEEMIAVISFSADGKQRWVFPEGEGSSATEPNRSISPNFIESILKNPKGSPLLTVTQNYQTPAGSWRCGIVIPVLREGLLFQYVIGILDLEKLLQEIKKENNLKYLKMTLQKEAEGVGKATLTESNQGSVFSSIPANGGHLSIHYLFDPEYFPGRSSFYPPLVGLTGILVSILLGLVIYFLRMSRFQSQFLEKEILANKLISIDLEASKNHLLNVIQHIGDGLISLGTDGIMIMVNPAAERMFLYSKEELVGQNVKMLMAEPDRSHHDYYIKRYLVEGDPRIIGIGREVTGIKKNGDSFPIHLEISEAVWDENHVFIGTVQDITERKQAHDIIVNAKADLEKKVEERTRELLQEKKLMVSLQVISEAANEQISGDRAFERALKEICFLLGWEVGHVYEVSQSPSPVLLPTDIYYFSKDSEDQGFKHATDPVQLDTNMCIPGRTYTSKSVVFVENFSTMIQCPRHQKLKSFGFKKGLGVPVLIGDRVVRVLEFYTKKERPLSRYLIETLEHIGVVLGRAVERSQIDRIKTEFIATAAHELRTPLSTIQGFSELLASRNISKEKREVYLSWINREAVNLSNIVSDFLDITRMESGKGLDLNIENGDLVQLLSEEIQIFQDAFPDRNLSLNIEGTPSPIAMDLQKIVQVVKNILSNACKYSPEDSPVHCALKFLKGKVLLEVKDCGVGMSPDELERVFDMFYRSNPSGNIKGTGLGLTIVKKLVEAHGGHIWLKSEPRIGTTVLISLPRGNDIPNEISQA